MAVDDIYTKLLLHMDGADGSQTFVDEAGHTMTRVGGEIDTAQFKFGGASGLFVSNGVTTPDSDDWILDRGSNANGWTIDFWVRWDTDPGTTTQVFARIYPGSTNNWVFDLSSNTLRFIQVDAGNTNISFTRAWNPVADTWYHIALVKDGVNGYMFFVNGVQVGTTYTSTNLIKNMSAVLHIAFSVDGWIDEFRISHTARWNANFTPPSEPYGASKPGNFFLFF